MKVIQLFKNEQNLIKRAAKDNRDAQRQLYEQHSPKMLSVCRQYVKDLQKAEEVMLNGFLKVFTHLKDFRNDGSFEGWIRRIMVRECVSYLRTVKKIEFDKEDMTVYGEATDVLNSEMNAEHIQKMIDALPDGYKTVFVLYAIEGYKHHEISKMLQISEGTSKSQLFKARKMLQEQLQLQNSTEYGTN